MRKENKRMLAVVLSAVCVLTAAGMDGSISVASTETRQTDSIEKTQTISSALASALEQIPEVAAVAVSTQEWHQKAVSNVDGETDVLLAGEEGSEVVGKLYHNTIVDVEEKGVVWTRVSADEVNGYVKSDSLAFGTDAVRRANQVCPVVEKPMEDNGAIVRTRESEPAKTLAQIEEEQRAAAQAAEEARKAEEAKKKAEEEAAAAQAQQQAQEAQASQQAVTAATSGEQALLAALIFCEAGGEPYEGQVAVGAVGGSVRSYEPCKKRHFPELNYRGHLSERTVWSGNYREAGCGTCRWADNGKLLSGGGRCPRRSQSDRGGTLFWKW